MKPSFDDMLMLYKQWLEMPQVPQSEFFKVYHWTRDEFFHEASERGVDV